MTKWDKLDIVSQLERIMSPSRIAATSFDTKRMVVYAAVEYEGNCEEYKGKVFGLVAPIYKTDGEPIWSWNSNYEVTSDEMPAETYINTRIDEYCHCPLCLLKRLSPPINEYARQWREVCRKNARRKTR